MGKPDFRAFERYEETDWNDNQVINRIPASAGSPYKDYLIINTSPLSYNLGSHQSPVQAQLESQALSALDQRMQGQSGGSTDAVYQQARGAIDNWYTIAGSGGGIASPQFGFVVYNDHTTSLSFMKDMAMGKDVADVSPENEAEWNDFRRHHEVSHTMLGLGEAGSDFMAAALMMRENRGADDTLSIIADIRNVTALQNPDASRYTTANSEAIEYVRAMNPDELENMSIEDLHQLAERFDRAGRDYALNPASAENSVKDALLSPAYDRLQMTSAVTLASPVPWLSGTIMAAANATAAADLSAQATQQNLDNLDLPEGSRADKLADRVSASYDRLNQGAFTP